MTSRKNMTFSSLPEFIGDFPFGFIANRGQKSFRVWFALRRENQYIKQQGKGKLNRNHKERIY